MPKRNAGIRSDTNGFRRDDMLKLLTKIRNGDNIWPVKLSCPVDCHMSCTGFTAFTLLLQLAFRTYRRCLSGTTIKLRPP